MYIYIFRVCVCLCEDVVLGNPATHQNLQADTIYGFIVFHTSGRPPAHRCLSRPCLAELISQNWRWRVQFSMAGVLTHASMRILVKCSRTWFCATDFRNSLSHLVSKYQHPFLWSFWWKEGFQKEQSIEKGSVWWFGDGFANKHKTVTSAKYLEVAQREGTESIKHNESTRQSPEWMMWMLRWFLRSSHSFQWRKVACEKLELEPQDPQAEIGGRARDACDACDAWLPELLAHVGSTVTAATATLHQDPMMEGGRYYWIIWCVILKSYFNDTYILKE